MLLPDNRLIRDVVAASVPRDIVERKRDRPPAMTGEGGPTRSDGSAFARDAFARLLGPALWRALSATRPRLHAPKRVGLRTGSRVSEAEIPRPRTGWDYAPAFFRSFFRSFLEKYQSV